MPKFDEIKTIFDNAAGGIHRRRFSKNEKYPLATEGVIATAKAAACFWLLNLIGRQQEMNKRLNPIFQVWTLNVDLKKQTGVVKGYNGKKLVVTQYIPRTDFPLAKLKLFLTEDTIYLPSEYKA